MASTVVHECPHISLYCEMFNCTKPTKYWIGAEDAPPSTKTRLCEDCTKHLFENPPAGLFPLQETEHEIDPATALGPNEEVIDPPAIDTETPIDPNVPLDDPREVLKGQTMTELRKIAKEKGMRGYSGLSEDELIDAILSHDAPVTEE